MKDYAFKMLMDFVKRFPESTDGPGHILFEDGNAADRDINWIIGLTEAAIGKSKSVISEDYLQVLQARNWYKDHSTEELQDTITFLKSFLEIPERHRLSAD
jgi:hypothetical protein